MMKDGNLLDDLRRHIGKLALRILLWAYSFPNNNSWRFYHQTGASIKMLLVFYEDGEK